MLTKIYIILSIFFIGTLTFFICINQSISNAYDDLVRIYGNCIPRCDNMVYNVLDELRVPVLRSVVFLFIPLIANYFAFKYAFKEYINDILMFKPTWLRIILRLFFILLITTIVYATNVAFSIYIKNSFLAVITSTIVIFIFFAYKYNITFLSLTKSTSLLIEVIAISIFISLILAFYHWYTLIEDIGKFIYPPKTLPYCESHTGNACPF